MTERPVDRAQDLFDRAVVLPPEDRPGFLEAACPDEPTLRSEVESLLACDADFREGTRDEGVLKSPLIRSPSGAPPDDGEGSVVWAAPRPTEGTASTRVGRYRIVRLIAEGGMGAVYEAEQDSPRRAVALKLVRPGLASATLLKRFSHEAQILGRLGHPGVAQVYEAGVAEDGRPFFAMEYIRGLPLDDYARRQRLDLRARVELLARVCDSVEHAHAQGIVHRDLKPANILVDESGLPKVLDFGVARVTNADLLTAAGLTQTGQLLGTPNYMSPEQVVADPDAIDGRTDVYALGVILFELAADRLPIQLQDRPLAEAVRLILEQDAPPLGSIRPELRGDVETIVARALEKAPSRRYPSAAELAADLRRWLAQQPILARPPSTLYHLHKFARRNKALVGGAITTGVSLVLGIVGTTMFAIAEARQRDQAEHHAQVAEDEKREARFQTYRARLSAAIAALQSHDALDAARHLDAAPLELRDWEWRHLHSRLDDSTSVLPLPFAGAGYLLPGPDRLRVAVMTADGLRLSEVEGGNGRILPVRVDGIRPDAVAWTRRGLRVVAWTGRTSFDLMDEEGRILRTVSISEIDSPRLVVVSPDGTRLATHWSSDGATTIVVIDATSGQRTMIRDGHPGAIRSLAFNHDGTRLASAGEGHTARLWDATRGVPIATCRGHADKLLGVAFSPEGTRLATTSSDGTVRQWDATTGQPVEPPYERHSGEVIAAAYSADGNWIASAGTDRAIRVWRAAGRQDVALLLGHTGGVIGLAFDPFSRRLASLSGNSWLRYAGDDTVRAWDVDPGATLPALRGHTGALHAVAYSPDGRWIASGAGDGSVRLWDAATGEPCATLPHPGGVWSLAYSPDGRWLATASGSDNRVRIWDTSTARLRRDINVPGAGLLFVAVSPDGSRVAATSSHAKDRNLHLHVCDSSSGELLFSAEGWALAYSPDGRRLAVLDADDRTVRLLDANTHATVARFEGHEQGVFKVAFSPDGRRLASCSADRTVRLWQVDTGACRVLRGHSDEVFAVAFHPDGTRLASGGEDRTVWLWDLARGEEAARLQGHQSFVWSLAFSPDGRSLVSGSGDFTLRLWDTEPLKSRFQERRELAALRPEAERLVQELCQQQNDPDMISSAIQADASLGNARQHAARIAVLRGVSRRPAE